MERQMHDRWNFLHRPRLTSGGKDEIYDNATDNKFKICLWGYHSLLANLSIGQNGRKRQALKNQIEITICSQFKVLMVIFSTKCISLFVNDLQFMYHVLKQCLPGLELTRARWGILNCSPMFN